MLEQVGKSYQQIYQDIINRFNETIKDNPDISINLIEKCKFIDSFAYAESDLLYFDNLSEDSEQCKAQIEKLQEADPERILYHLSNNWGDDMKEIYASVQTDGMDNWSNKQKILFYQILNNNSKWQQDSDHKYAYEGYTKTADPQFILGSAQYLYISAQEAQAIELLTDFQSKNQEDQFELIELYINLGLLEKTTQLYEAIEGKDQINDTLLLKIHSTIDNNYKLDEEKLSTIQAAWNGQDNIKSLIALAGKQKKYTLAQDIYHSWTTTDFWQDPFKYHKFKLYQKSHLWQTDIQDFYAILMWVSVILACILLLLIILVPIHYRGLYRRVHQKPAYQSLTQWTLKHALFLGTVFILIDIFLLLIYQYDYFFSLFFGDDTVAEPNINGLHAKMYFFHALVFTLLATLVFKAGRSLFKVSGKELLNSMLLSVGVFILFKIVVVTVLYSSKVSTLGAATDSITMVLTDIKANYGLLLTYLSIALLTPIMEEYLFRGVLLNSFTKHISFAWANIIQAALFALIHDNPEVYFHHFLFGLIVGYFVKKQKHIYGAIAFHSINNALAVTAFSVGIGV
jgi:membrane protease YdiL (CAAX protease family)